MPALNTSSLPDLIFTMLFFRCFLLNLNQASNLLDISKKKEQTKQLLFF